MTFRVLQKLRREGCWPARLDLLILSAKYGMIVGPTPIEDYDLEMTSARAVQVRHQVMQVLQEQARSSQYSEVYVDVGKAYRQALCQLESLFPNATLTVAEGRIGERLSQLRTWILKKWEEHEAGRGEASTYGTATSNAN